MLRGPAACEPAPRRTPPDWRSARQCRSQCRIELLAAGRVAEFIEHGQGGIGHARAQRVGVGDPLLDLLDQFAAVPRMLVNQVGNDETQLAIIEQPDRTAATFVHFPVDRKGNQPRQRSHSSRTSWRNHVLRLWLLRLSPHLCRFPGKVTHV